MDTQMYDLSVRYCCTFIVMLSLPTTDADLILCVNMQVSNESD